MKIDEATLRGWTNERSGLSFQAILNITRLVYCTKMTLCDLCTTCQNCKTHVLASLEFKEEPRSPEALFTWMLKREFAIAQDEELDKAKYEIKKDKFGVPILASETPFEDLLKEFS